MRRAPLLAAAAAVLLLTAGPAAGQDAPPPAAPKLVVGIKDSPPFVSLDTQDGEPRGFSVDLIKLVAAQLDPPHEVDFVPHVDLKTHLDSIRAREVDIGIAATSITAEREEGLDFSLPFYWSGLDIAAPTSDDELWSLVIGPELFKMGGIIVLFVLICAVLIWATERGSDTFDDERPLVGIAQGVWWTIVTMSTVGYGDFVPKRWFGRCLGVFIIFAGIILFGIAIASFSSALTVQRLSTGINGPEGLRNKRVAVLKDTTAHKILLDRGIDVVAVNDLDEAFETARAGDAAAVVGDRPQLLHHLRETQEDGFELVGNVFAEQRYGITFPLGSPLRKKINIALLELMEGDPSPHKALQVSWFGEAQDKGQ